MSDLPSYLDLHAAEDVTEEMLSDVADCLDGWFPDDDERLDSEDFIDRFSDNYLLPRGCELGNYDSPASRKILAEARKIRRER